MDPPARSSPDHAVPHPTVVGPYQVRELIGEGGMGVVYAAEQLHPVRRRVALKMMRPGMVSPDVVTRFEAERQALSAMDHPGIARVLDAGVSEEGRPYFVMELVKGIAIDKYCDRFRLTERERLGLFVALCEAVQHAHQKGVIHRDLKPANVLVTELDGKPVPKVIDFGIAKATGRTLVSDPMMTMLGQPIGTLAYMSPEQAEGSELDVDTRADVYSLGVILYKLLSGAVPWDPQESTVPQFLAKLLSSETLPPLPKERLTVHAETAEQIARARGTDLDRLRKTLSGDIQWVVMKAIEKDRNRRYETANGLRLDLIRYMRGEAVIARPPSTPYRLRRFVGRNRRGVAAAAFAVILLAAGAAMTTLGLLRARAAEADALAAREQAQLQAEAAEEVVNFLVNLFEVSDPGEARGNEITARELLDRGAAQVEENLAEQPLVQARMLATIGTVHRKLGLLDDAIVLLGRALRLQEVALGPDGPGVAQILAELGAAQRQRGDLEPAEESLLRALAIQRAAGDSASHEAGHSLGELGSVQLVRGRLDEAEQSLTEALEIEETRLGEDHPEIATIVSDLGALSVYRGEFIRAEQYFARASSIRERQLGLDHPDLASTLNNLGAAYWYQGRYEEALATYVRARGIWLQTLEPEHPQVAGIQNNIAEVFWKLGRLGEAETLFTEALSLKERMLTPDNTSIATTLLGLANVYRDQGQYDLAEPRYRRAIQISEEALGPNHARLREPLLEYATMLNQSGREDEASGIEARVQSLGTSN